MSKKLFALASVAAAAIISMGNTSSAAPASDPAFSAEIRGGATEDGNGVLAASIGSQLNKSLGVEGVYERGFSTQVLKQAGAPKDVNAALNDVTASRLSDTFLANAVVTVPLGNLKPYVVGGAGYRLSTVDQGVWDYGAGVRFDLTKAVSFDARAQREQGFKDHQDTTAYTAGVAFRF